MGIFGVGHSFSPGLFLADRKAKKTTKSHTLSIFSQSQLWPLCSGSRVVSSLLFHNQNLLQLSHFFLQGLSSDLITFSGHSLISESFLPRTPVRPCLPHIFSFSLQNTEHDIPRCAHATPVCCFILGRFGLQLHLQYLGEHPPGPCSVRALGGELPSQL